MVIYKTHISFLRFYSKNNYFERAKMFECELFKVFEKASNICNNSREVCTLNHIHTENCARNSGNYPNLLLELNECSVEMIY